MSSPNFSFEKRLWKEGFKYVAGADEVGRGCFAGPVVASAVAFTSISNFQFPIFNEKGEEIKIDDSKKLTSKQREISAKWIKKNALTYGTGSVSAKVINRVGMAKATQRAFRRAVKKAGEKLDKRIEFLLIDAFYIPYVSGLPRSTKKIKGNGKIENSKSKQLAIIRGDEKSFSIAAASIIAKVYRDSLMGKIGKRSIYKRYKWFKNKGYATKEHREAILKYGLTGYHRKQFVETYFSNFFSSQFP